MKKVRLTASLGVKLFLLTAGLVLITVGTNAWQSSRLFKKDLQRFSEDETILQAAEAAQISAAIVDNWAQQVGLLMHTLPGLSETARQEQLTRFLGASSELVAFQLIGRQGQTVTPRNFAFTSRASTARFEGRDPKQVAATLKKAAIALVPQAGHSRAGVILKNLTPSLQLPMLALAQPFSFAGGEEIWAVLVVWQNRLSTLLPSSGLVSSYFVDAQGEVLSASDKGALIEGDALTIGTLMPLVKQTEAGSGFTTFGDANGGSWLGAFAKVPGSSSWVMVRRNAKALEDATQALVKRTIVWAWVFVLVAVLASVLGASGLTRHIRALTLVTRRIAGGDFDTRVGKISGDEVGILASAIGDMAGQIKHLLHVQVAQARLEQEMATAKIVQESFFPKGVTHSEALSVAWASKSASECGGDWWGYFPLGGNLELICIADATGHGAPAALVTAIAYAVTSIVSDPDPQKRAGAAWVSPSSLLLAINSVLHKALGGQLGMTFFAALIDTSSGQMTYANAGHNFPIYVPAGAKPGEDTVKISSVNKANGIPLGFDLAATYQEKTINLLPGDKVIFFTDGLLECCSPADQQWGKPSFVKVLKAHPQASAEDLLKVTIAKAFEHYGSAPLKDDVTLVVAEFIRAERLMVAV